MAGYDLGLGYVGLWYGLGLWAREGDMTSLRALSYPEIGLLIKRKEMYYF